LTPTPVSISAPLHDGSATGRQFVFDIVVKPILPMESSHAALSGPRNNDGVVALGQRLLLPATW
jgi:hypothetical protein